MSGLALCGLSAGYGRRRVIDGLTVDALPAGEVCALLGPNGSGKSTLLKAVAGLLPTPVGSVLLDGGDLAGHALAARSALAAYLPQTLPPDVHLRVFESVLVAANAHAGAAMQRVGPDDVQALLASLGIGQLGMRYLDELSGGQKQLAGLAQALVRRPRVLLLDEPLSALDLNYQFHVMALLRRETRARGLVTVIVLHDVNAALRHADRVMLLREGRLVAHGVASAVVTPGALAEVYGVTARVETCSMGLRHVHVDGISRPVE